MIEEFVSVKIGTCWCCFNKDVGLDNSGVCEDCHNKLEKQKETGRCGWCGNIIEECSCDDYEIMKG